MTENAVEKIKDAFESILADRKTLVKILSVVLILLIAAVLRIHASNKADITIETAKAAEETVLNDGVSDDNTVIFVDLGGAVAEPGVYQVAKNTRLYEVIEMAGGLAENADTDSVNRASFVEDGQKIIIPVKGESITSGALPATSDILSDSSGLININTASLDELKTLNGIGDVIAGRIIEYRSSKAFKSKEDIMSVDGIGTKMYEKIKDDITF